MAVYFTSRTINWLFSLVSFEHTTKEMIQSCLACKGTRRSLSVNRTSLLHHSQLPCKIATIFLLAMFIIIVIKTEKYYLRKESNVLHIETSSLSLSKAPMAINLPDINIRTTDEKSTTNYWTEQTGNGVSKYIFTDLLQSKPSVGTFVEFGCADGTTNSNTFAYEKMGWTGLCIEPNYQNYMKASQSRNYVIHGLVTSSNMNFTYAQMSGECDQTSGIIEFYSHAFMDILSDCEKKGLVERISMKGTPLDHYLDMFGMKRVDWISVDCEGCEAAFITSFNFTKYQVQIVNYEPNTAAIMHTDEIDAALKHHGFNFDRELQDIVYRKGEFHPHKVGAEFRVPE